ncbi:hypothetical protein SSYRP_v1c02960 [Spiroplasma syrphidicola EA-1]|uniref:Transmembrane protein n=1 Tax=Spiroplasma syrphidicola EA-1 TaxID=1276229 RepID=R4U3B5_9MOLU|nr:hypothetical protein [Spiroplasma syrphidicola]AGM25892.1 hypothetical protein SSYRP_v1c02960 [Spiroplasma syrphidicola EA-1]
MAKNKGKNRGTWSNVNKITKHVSVHSKRKSIIIACCAALYLGALIPMTYLAAWFLSEVLSYGGIETDGTLPNLDKGEYFQVDFAYTPLRDNPLNQPTFEKQVIKRDLNNKTSERIVVKSTSLRLEYAYNYIFETAPKAYISKNFLYKDKYPEPDKIEIVNIYTNPLRTKTLELSDVQNNKFNIIKNLLNLEIKYNGELQSQLIIMPTMFVGMESFLSNFFEFKLGNSMHKNLADNVIWENQTNIVGDQANGLMVPGESTNPLNFADKVYQSYEQYFDKFYNANKGEDKEFVGNFNPYSNFVISSVNTKDPVFENLPVYLNSYNYLFDIDTVFSESNNKAKISPLAQYAEKKKLERHTINIKEKYIAQLFVFLKNVIETSKNPGLALPVESVPNDWKEWYQTIKPKKLDLTKPEEFYFMFLPEGETLQHIFGVDLKKYIAQILDGKEPLRDAILRIGNDILANPTSTENKWLFKWNALPFQTHARFEDKDYQMFKRKIQEQQDLVLDFGGLGTKQPKAQNYITINHPNLHYVTNLATTTENTKYAINDLRKRNELFVNYWSSNLYNSANLNTITLKQNFTSASEISNAIKEQLINQTWQFAVNLDKVTKPKLDILAGMTKENYISAFTSDYNIEILPVNKTHSDTGNFNNWAQAVINHNVDNYQDYTVLDIRITAQTGQLPPNLQIITFRFNTIYSK